MDSSIRKINDSQSYVVHYYENGSIKDSFEVSNAKRNGYYFYYLENGRLLKEGYYFNDKLRGYLIEYYPNNKIKSKTLYYDNVKYGSSEHYYKNGLPSIYNCYDFEGKNRRVKIYDSMGNIVKNEGETLCQAETHSIDYAFHKNKRILIEIIASTPPNELIDLTLITFRSNNVLKHVNADISYNTIKYIDSFGVIGNYQLMIVSKSTDTLLHIVRRDTIITDFKVIE
jgi:hypothetical protein